MVERIGSSFKNPWSVVAGSTFSKRQMRTNSTTWSWRSPRSIFDKKLCGNPRLSANSRCVTPDFSLNLRIKAPSSAWSGAGTILCLAGKPTH